MILLMAKIFAEAVIKGVKKIRFRQLIIFMAWLVSSVSILLHEVENDNC